MKLKYLFRVEFWDGKTYFQNANDTSETVEGKNAFYDVLQEIEKGNKVHIFEMSEVDPQGSFVKYFSVNLHSGEFQINGVSFLAEGKKQLPIDNPERELIYFKQHQVDAVVGIKDGQITEQKETAHRITYCIGWKCKIGGKAYQQIIKVS